MKESKRNSIKQHFLSDVCKTDHAKTVYQRLFNGVLEEENRLHKDLCEMDFDELCRTLRRLKQVRITLVQQTISSARTYLTWCEKHGYTKQNQMKGHRTLNDWAALLSVDPDDRIERDDIIKAVAPFNTREGRGEWYLAFLLSVFEGVEDGDLDNLLYLKVSEISGNTVRIKNGKRIQITPELKSALLATAQNTEMDVATLHSEKRRFRPLVPYSWQTRESVFKGVNHGDLDKEDLYCLRLFRKCLADVNAITGKQWTRECIRQAGLWDRFTKACANQGEDLYRDMISGDSPLTTTGRNKDIVYTSILLSLQSSMKWSEWLETYVSWAVFLEED